MIDGERLDRVLLQLGHDDFNRGTTYIREAVYAYEPGMSLTRQLYKDIADLHGCSVAAVEGCMRHSIEKAWMRGSEQMRELYFGYSVDPCIGRPTIGEYVARLSRLCRGGW